MDVHLLYNMIVFQKNQSAGALPEKKQAEILAECEDNSIAFDMWFKYDDDEEGRPSQYGSRFLVHTPRDDEITSSQENEEQVTKRTKTEQRGTYYYDYSDRNTQWCSARQKGLE